MRELTSSSSRNAPLTSLGVATPTSAGVVLQLSDYYALLGLMDEPFLPPSSNPGIKMEGPTFPELVNRYGLSEADTSQQASDSNLELITLSCCEQWKSLPPYLVVETIVATDIDKTQKDPQEKRHDFFRKWKKIKGSGATYKVLIAALLKIKCVEDAEKVCEILKDSFGLQTASAASGSPIKGW